MLAIVFVLIFGGAALIWAGFTGQSIAAEATRILRGGAAT